MSLGTHSLISLVIAIGMVSLSTACVTEVRPVQPELVTMADSEEGIASGRIHLVYNGQDQRAGLRFPATLTWWMSEETKGQRFSVVDLPVDGLYVLKLPSGRYRIKTIGFRDVFGQWRGNLPASFIVAAAGCTYLGTWHLDVTVGPFAGQVFARVSNEEGEIPHVLHRISEVSSCPLTRPPLETAAQGSLKLTSGQGSKD